MTQPTDAIDPLCINTLRTLSIGAVQEASSGHPGLPMGAATMAYVLWTRYLRFDPSSPEWINRDRFVLSAGHGSMLLYSLLWRWRSVGSRQQFNRPNHTIVDHYTYVVVSDGDLMEGVASAQRLLRSLIPVIAFPWGRLSVFPHRADAHEDSRGSAFRRSMRCRPSSARISPADVPVRGVAFLVSVVAIIVRIAATFVAIHAWRSTRHEQQSSSGDASGHAPRHTALEIGEGRTRFMALAGIMTSMTFLLVSVVRCSAVFVIGPCA